MITKAKTAKETMKALSLDGKAYVALRIPFSADVELKSYKNPSSIPDGIIDLALGNPQNDAVAYKGRLQGFTTAARVREQNRGFGND